MSIVEFLKSVFRGFNLWRFLVSFFTNNLHIKLLSLLASFIIFSIIQNQNLDEKFLQVPLRITKLNPSYTLATEVPETVTLHLTGSRGAVANVDVNAIFAEISLRNVRSTSEGSGKFKPIIKGVPETIKDFNVTPKEIPISLSRVTTKWVKVEPEFTGRLRSGLTLRDSRIKPGSMEISGPRNIINDTTVLRTEPIPLASISETREIEDIEISKSINSLIKFRESQRFKVTVFIDEEIVPEADSGTAPKIKVVNLDSAQLQIQNLDDLRLRRIDYEVGEADRDLFDAEMDLNFFVDLRGITTASTYFLTIEHDLPDYVKLKDYLPKRLKVVIIPAAE